MIFEGIVEIWEVDSDDANRLLKLGWKILQITQRTKSKTEDGFVHSKFVGVSSEIVYVMGRTEEIPQRKHGSESAYYYEERLKETT